MLSCFRTWMPYYYKNINLMLGNPVNYLLAVLAVVIAILPSIINNVAIKSMRPTLIQIIQEVEASEEMSKQLEKDLEVMEKNRAVELELTTIKKMPENVERPELLKVRVDDLEKEKEKKQQTPVSSSKSILSNIPEINEEEGEEGEEGEEVKRVLSTEIEMTESTSDLHNSSISIRLSSSSHGEVSLTSSNKSILLSPGDMQSPRKMEGENENETELGEIPLEDANDYSLMEGARMSSRMDLSPISENLSEENLTPSASSSSLTTATATATTTTATATATTTLQPIEDEYWNLPSINEIKRRKQSLIMEKRGSFFALGRQQSIRSFAGINALYVCTQLHGSSEQQSVDSDTQAELARMVNHHGWKDGVKPKFMGQKNK